MEAVKQGFNDLIPLSLIEPFDEKELEYLVCGLRDVDVEDLKNNTVYLKGYSAEDQVIVWFWKVVENMDNENKARLLQYVTGTARIPLNGFADLQGNYGPQQFSIRKVDHADAQLESHMMFNQIDLPPYQSFDELNEKLKHAIKTMEGFNPI